MRAAARRHRPSEQRWFASPVEVRDSATGNPRFFGHAAVFDQEVDFGYMRERVAKGAFAKTIKDNADVRFLTRDASGTCSRLRADDQTRRRLSMRTTTGHEPPPSPGSIAGATTTGRRCGPRPACTLAERSAYATPGLTSPSAGVTVSAPDALMRC